MPNVRRCAVAIVRQRLDDHRDAVRAVALVDDRLEGLRIRIRARAARDRALDVVLRHGIGARLLDRVLQREVAGWIGSPLLRRDDDRARELREQLAALRVGGALLVLDRRPLAMPGHSSPPVPNSRTVRAPAYLPSAPGGTMPRGSARRERAPVRPRARRAPRRPHRSPAPAAPG